MRSAAAVITLITCVSGAAYAQDRHPWTFDELAAKADCVLIADAVETQDKGQTTHPELKPAYPVVEFDTTFTVRTVFKPCDGAGAGATIHLKHYAPNFTQLAQGVINGGSLLNLNDKNPYLLFLKQTAGAPYEPISGQTWPTMSVFPLVNPPER